MKRLTLFSILCGLAMTFTTAAQYKITVKIDGYTQDTCILGYQVGQTTYIAQKSSTKDADGAFVFEGKDTLMGGLYSVLIRPKNEFFQFIISNKAEQKNLKITTKIEGNPAADLSANLKIYNSPDNDAFGLYKEFLTKMRAKSEKNAALMAEAKSKNDSLEVEKLTKTLKEFDAEVFQFQSDLVKKYPKFLSPKLIYATRQPDIPKELTKQTDIFNYYKSHFWDTYDWSDARMIRTPVLKDKLDTYVDKLTVQQVDSVAAACVYLIDNALKYKSKDIFQFVAVHLLNKYAKQEIICMDGVYVTIAQKYYCNGLAYWLDSTQTANICEDAANMAPLRCGKSAPEIRLRNIKDSTNVSLYNIRKPFTAVYFWDPTCGNCGKMSEKIVPIYNKYKDRGFEIIGVCSKDWKEVGLCRKKVEDMKMNWLNVSDEPYPLAWVKKYYDLRSNPFLYLLDENKNILFKRITAEQLDQILEREFKLYEERKK